MEGAETLRASRGEERVTFGDVADHLEDFVTAAPDARSIVDRLATFLARVERVPHEHETGGPGSTAIADPPRLDVPG